MSIQNGVYRSYMPHASGTLQSFNSLKSYVLNSTDFRTVFPPYCKNQGVVDCTDPNSILIYTILTLAQQNATFAQGVTAQEIVDELPFVCNVNWTLSDATVFLTAATKRGIITTTGAGIYAVNAAMSLVNPINAKYFCVMQLYKC